MADLDAAVRRLVNGSHPLLAPATLRDVDGFDVDLAMEAYSTAFSDPREWRFVFSGNLEPKSARRLFEKYLASIPSSPSRPDPLRILPPDKRCVFGWAAARVQGALSPTSPDMGWAAAPFESPRSAAAGDSKGVTATSTSSSSSSAPSVGNPFVVPRPADVVPFEASFLDGATTSCAERLRRRMQDPVACLEMAWPIALGGAAPDPSSTRPASQAAEHLGRLEDSLLLNFCSTILEQRLRDTLRLKMGAIYGVSVSLNFGTSPPLAPERPKALIRGHLAVSLTCSPDTLASLEAVVLAEVESLSTSGPTVAEVLSAVKTTRTSREEEQRTNDYWVNAILSAYNAPRYAGDASETLAEKEAMWQNIARDLECDPELSGKNRLLGCFQKLLGGPHAVVTLEPSPGIPWQWIGAALGAAGVAAGAYYLTKARRPWR